MSEGNVNKAGYLLDSVFQELPDQSFECPIHGRYYGKLVKFLEVAAGEPECPQCISEREMQKEKENAKKRALNRRHEEIDRLAAMNIGKKFWNSTFENFNAYNDELRGHLETCRKFAENPVGKLVLLGENGNGKNHLASAILKKTGGIMYKCYEIGIMLRDCYNGINSEAEFFDMLCSTPLLIIDEVDKIKETEAKNNWMSYVIGKRYDDMLPIIFIANGHLKDDCSSQKKPCPKCLEYHLENDILSRIFEDGTLLEFTSPDYRYK
jgi:DNA replication protein DnaC